MAMKQEQLQKAKSRDVLQRANNNIREKYMSMAGA
jgi:hypothetical protein